MGRHFAGPLRFGKPQCGNREPSSPRDEATLSYLLQSYTRRSRAGGATINRGYRIMPGLRAIGLGAVAAGAVLLGRWIDTPAETQQATTVHDGQHDFDFLLGSWK